MAKLKTDPGKAFHYSNAGVAHLRSLWPTGRLEVIFTFFMKGERVLNPIGVRQDSLDCQRRQTGAIGPYSQGYSGVTTTAAANTPVSATCHCTAVSGPASGSSRLQLLRCSPGPRSPRSPITGAQWWVYPHHKDAPRDLVQCAGFRNNHGWVIPSLDLVFVRVGTGDKYPADFESDLVKRVVAFADRDALKLGWHHSTLWRKLNGKSRINRSDEMAISQAVGWKTEALRTNRSGLDVHRGRKSSMR